jgi:hypothetical protein
MLCADPVGTTMEEDIVEEFEAAKSPEELDT